MDPLNYGSFSPHGLDWLFNIFKRDSDTFLLPWSVDQVGGGGGGGGAPTLEIPKTAGCEEPYGPET